MDRSKTSTCPRCKSTKIAKIVYCLPANMDAWVKEIGAGRIVPGGCVTYGDDPKWSCNGCGYEFGKRSNQ